MMSTTNNTTREGRRSSPLPTEPNGFQPCGSAASGRLSFVGNSRERRRQNRRQSNRQESRTRLAFRPIETLPLTVDERADFGITSNLQHDLKTKFTSANPEFVVLQTRIANGSAKKIDVLRFNRAKFKKFQTHCINCSAPIPAGKSGRVCQAPECQALLTEPSMMERIQLAWDVQGAGI